MVLTHYQSFQELENIDRQVDQVFNEPELLGNTNFQVPVIKMQEKEEIIVIKVILPTLEENSLEMQVTAESIVLSGKLYDLPKTQKMPSQTVVKNSQKFRKIIALPQPIRSAGIKSDYFNGILTLLLPKVVESPAYCES
ncbi:Hsp20/alpha crystallin family protein [Lyngbya sp. PCC 8106]|uniref:Hsp20/alpha crystallin family protein n=1 Tax=Lyngbya sp. (strain PCC 8106) TaxID=313612 RepID=UPI0000EA90F7|nr:Hsp20/alpha crystallin family protein [Lyngbya sp. PCC 8106]EAW34008.1 16.6 kDa small heat shock protein molecular chaperone [Lyngbya sp. PCC 8106]